MGELSLQTFIDEIACRGFLIAPTDGIAKISTPIAGTVEKVLVKTGDFVNQGQVVCNVSGTDFWIYNSNLPKRLLITRRPK